MDAGRLRDLVAALRTHVDTPEARQCIEYIAGNRHRMRYPQFRARGLCVSSGVVEAGCKQIAARLKRAGMRWTVAGANAAGEPVGTPTEITLPPSWTMTSQAWAGASRNLATLYRSEPSVGCDRLLLRIRNVERKEPEPELDSTMATPAIGRVVAEHV